jgi:hypothetical protein
MLLFRGNEDSNPSFSAKERTAYLLRNLAVTRFFLSFRKTAVTARVTLKLRKITRNRIESHTKSHTPEGFRQ